MQPTAPLSITMTEVDFFNISHQYGGGGDDDRSMQSSIGMASSAKAPRDENFMAANQFNTTTQDGTTAATANNADNLVVETDTNDDALTAEAENAVTKERQLLYKDKAAKLQSILEHIKNSTKNILREMDSYLQETEEVEKTFIRCRANTQKESQRMEQVEPDVIAATQRFMAQAQEAQMFGGAGGPMNFMAMMGANGAGGGASSMGMTSVAPGNNVGGGAASMMGMAGTVTPRGNDGASMAGSMAGSSMAGSMA